MVALPDLPSNIGKRRRAKHPDGTYFYFTIVDEIRLIQSTAPHKALYLQQIQFDDKRIELRLGYYVIGKNPRWPGNGSGDNLRP